MLERSHRPVVGERALVAAGQLARVERGSERPPLRDPDLDAATDQTRVERVVAGVDAGRVGGRRRAPGGVSRLAWVSSRPQWNRA
jgi:hypothetical protein